VWLEHTTKSPRDTSKLTVSVLRTRHCYYAQLYSSLPLVKLGNDVRNVKKFLHNHHI
ncbi:hypothetical protein L9F63_001043, partial [Diploptera punctata]